METLLVVAHHRNQCYGRVKPHRSGRFGSSPSSRNFRGINCRTFESGPGILPNPFSSSCKTNPSISCSSISPCSSPKTPSSSINAQWNAHSGDKSRHKTAPVSSPIPISVKGPRKFSTFNDGIFNSDEDSAFSELWAGPAYSNSPPPSSLPIPKFSMKPKRTVSLDLPLPDSKFELPPIAKSAPASPSRKHDSPTRDMFCTTDSATKTLRRILNLDLGDD
ncbi:unnamed protein product [Linum tenue]|uniref:Uncharacterized protein n=1 Tax=Linum tenue TaxID=586396 RepID=A0AAV0IUD5_9ROSI|nr:unnamed protein product [Linum tenue]